MTRIFALALVLLAGPAFAADLDIKAFYGKFAGAGVAKSEDSLYFGTTVRDTDVEIRPTADGFSVAWTTVLRQGGDPAKPDVRRRAATTTFGVTPKKNFYAGKENGDLMNGGMASWAVIKGNTLTVHALSVAEDGGYEAQTYARTLTGEGMDLVYTRVKDGEKSRVVKAKLTRQAN
jgi:hypothetical protein